MCNLVQRAAAGAGLVFSSCSMGFIKDPLQQGGSTCHRAHGAQVVRVVAKTLADMPPGAKRRRDDSVSVGRWFLNVRVRLHG